MQEGLLVLRGGKDVLVGVRKDNAWHRLLALREGGEAAAGNVYRGRVVRIVPGMQAAFVDIGARRTAFLHLDDAPTPGKLRLHEAVLVQVRKEPLGDKGARVTGQLSLSGRYVVSTPTARHVAISQRIVDPDRRRALMALLQPLTALHGGIVVRTAAEHADDAQLTSELSALAARHAELRAAFAARKKPGLLSVDDAQMVARCQALFAGTAGEVWSNDAAFGTALADALTEQGVAVRLRVGPHVLQSAKQADKLGFFTALRAALRREVALKGGGSLVIDECEALTVVDVNSGSYVGGGEVEASMLALNLAAAHALAKELTRRTLGGIVVVDFVDLKDPDARRLVSQTLRDALAADGGRTYVSPMSELGLVQLTRRRGQPSLRQQTTAPCAACAGRGRVRAPWQVALLALHAAEFALRKEPAALLVLNVAPAVDEALRQDYAAAVGELEARHACNLLVVARGHFLPEQVELLHGARPGSVQAETFDF